MSNKKKRDNFGFVFSTDDDFDFDYSEDQKETPDHSDQRLRVQHDRKGRKGKTVTLITGFQGSDDDAKALTKTLKSKCGVGGSYKDGEIVIQGEKRDQVVDILKKMGYHNTKSSGG
ncbi:MAG TPA: translation initiation factor [Saprospiraceae bacterium]|nr:translation initiation factor [Saprospiraceae bacterium]